MWGPHVRVIFNLRAPPWLPISCCRSALPTVDGPHPMAGAAPHDHRPHPQCPSQPRLDPDLAPFSFLGSLMPLPWRPASDHGRWRRPVRYECGVDVGRGTRPRRGVLPPAARTTRSTAAAPCTSATAGTGCPGKAGTRRREVGQPQQEMGAWPPPPPLVAGALPGRRQEENLRRGRRR
jgi:hypothetical protein